MNRRGVGSSAGGTDERNQIRPVQRFSNELRTPEDEVPRSLPLAKLVSEARVEDGTHDLERQLTLEKLVLQQALLRKVGDRCAECSANSGIERTLRRRKPEIERGVAKGHDGSTSAV